MKTPITKESLIEFGMVVTNEEDPLRFIYPLEKVLTSENDPDNEDAVLKMSLVITNERNSSELALILPSGDTLFLGGIESIEELKIFEKAITSFEPVY